MGGAKRVLKSDPGVTVVVPRWELHRFVEVGRHTGHRPVLVRKIDAYIRVGTTLADQRRRSTSSLV